MKKLLAIPENNEISPEEIRVQLRRLAASPQFQAGKPRSLLQHLVEKTLEGSLDELNESFLARAFFESFDSEKKDSNVRVTVRDIRARLTEYYAAPPGARDPVIITVPKSTAKAGYIAEFTRNPQHEQLQRVALALTQLIGRPIPVGLLQELLDEPSFRLDVHIRYFQGIQLASQRTQTGFQKAIECFNEVLQTEPNYAKAHAALAECYMGSTLALESPVVLSAAEKAAECALQLNSNFWEAHAAMGAVRMVLHWDWHGAAGYFEQAEKLNPAALPFYLWYGIYLIARGDARQAVANLERRLATEPQNANLCTTIGLFLYATRRYDEAERRITQAMDLDPHSYRPYIHLSTLCVELGRYQEALDAAEHALRLFSEPQKLFGFRVVCQSALGRKEAARETAREMTAYGKNHYVPPLQFALAYQGLGNLNRSLLWMKKACDSHDPLALWLHRWPILDPLRQHVGFPGLLAKIGLPSIAHGQNV